MMDRLKIRFPFINADGMTETETMWTAKRDDGYEIDNIPFYAKELALGDVVEVSTEPDGGLCYAGLVRASGHSTIRLWFSDPAHVGHVRSHLRQMGCASELSDMSQLVAVDVPPNVSYPNVKAYLDREEAAGTFEYQEACLGFG